ncbi:hypothetical protein AB1Y20_022594 [Prymnesium parvum]|uniref:CBS domain-containing protein n=1 Tax=Prymnesium parvum TaxID=97485 RepID=A0AB34JGP7_PRYPA
MALPKFNFTLPVLQMVSGSAAKVHKIAPNASAFRAAIDMIKGRLNSLVVSGPEGMAGILTERDFLKLPMEKGHSRKTSVADIMTPAAAVTTVPSSYTVQKCVSTMRSIKVRHLPIVEKGEVKAVLSMQDVSQQIAKTMSQQQHWPAGEDPSTLTVGDLLDDPNINTPTLGDIQMSSKASVADAVERMREMKSGSLLVRIPGVFMPYSNQFGIFTERDLVYSVAPYDEESPHDIKLEEVSRFTSGTSKAMMQAIVENPSLASTYRPTSVTCVQRTTKVRDCLSLMLGNGLLYVPVTENKQPINIISMRDINHFLAPETGV